MTQGSLQLRRYLRARRAGVSTEDAAALAPLLIAEAHAIDDDEAKGEFAHIDTETPHLDPSQSTAPAAETATLRRESDVNAGWAGGSVTPAKDGPGATPPQEEDMARAKRAKVDQVEEIKKPDFELVKRLYFNDIKPAKSKQATEAQEQSAAFKEIAKTAHVDPAVAKFVFALVETEQSKCEHKLRSLNGLLQIFRLHMPRDMVDVAEGKPDESNVVPIGESSRPQLATIPSDDSDLAGDDTLEAAE
jgi:hypothetical protein